MFVLGGPGRIAELHVQAGAYNDEIDEASGHAVVLVARDNSKMSVMTEASQKLFITMFN